VRRPAVGVANLFLPLTGRAQARCCSECPGERAKYPQREITADGYQDDQRPPAGAGEARDLPQHVSVIDISDQSFSVFLMMDAGRDPVARRFTDEELELLLLVADRAAPAIERGRLLETINSGRDELENLSRRLLAAQEEERRRLAVELHDELGQILTALKINLESKRQSATIAPHLADAIDAVDQAMDRVRDLP
jgi:signal transduction histidine kinase